MLLIFLRHGQAEDFAASGRDEDRALTAEGIAELEVIMPAAVRILPVVDRIIASPYLRATQTAEQFQLANQKLTGRKNLIETCYSLTPSSDPADFIRYLEGNTAEVVLAVTHQPFVSTAISVLSSGRESTAVSMPRASICSLEFVGNPAVGSGRIYSLFRPKQLRAISDSVHTG